MSKVELFPTTRIGWWDNQLKSLWEPRIERVRQAYNAAELATVISGLRRVYVYHINSNSFEESYEFLRKNKLMFFPTNKSGIYSGFSHRHQPVKPGEPYTLYGAAVRDEEAGELFVKASAGLMDHDMIGELLGYPVCCREFFSSTWSNVSVDPIYEAALNTPSVQETEEGTLEVECHPYCNNMLRYFGVRITPHLTCSLQCENTIKWGEEWIETLKQIDEEAAEWAVELLSMPLTWNCLKGVAVVDTPIFRGITNSDGTLEKKMVRNLGYVVSS